MGEPIIILLLLFGLASASQVLPNGCPADFSVHRLLRHETECDKYYSCSNGQRILMSCPTSTLFDYDLQICNHASAVVCKTQPTTEFADTTTEFVDTTTEIADATTGIGDVLPNDCPADFTIHLLLPHDTDCDKFYTCSNGQKILFTCPGGTLFDLELQVCNWAHAVSCSTLSLETTTFSQGFTTIITVIDDTPVEALSTSSSESIGVTSSSLTEASSSKPEYTTDLFTTDAAVSVPSVCPDGLFGNVPHPEICDSYYVCTGWDPIQLFCLPGHEFDPELQTCTEITEGGCTWLQQQHTTTERDIISDPTIVSDATDLNTESTTSEPPTTSETTITTQETAVVTNEVKETTFAPTTVTKLTTTKETSTPEATTEVENVTGVTESTTEFNPVSPSICPDGFFGSVPHPEICDSYYVCTGWDPIQLFCLPGFEFDLQLQTCVQIAEGGCTRHEQQHTTPESEFVPETTGGTNTRTTAFETTPEITITTETTFEPTTEAQFTTTRESGTAETEDVSVDATTVEMNPTNPSICPDDFFGSVPHPEICESYYVCTGWDPIQLFCIPGFEFDPNLQTCVEISQGGCTWSQTTTTRVTDTTIPDSSTTGSTETKPSITTDITTKEPSVLTTTEVTAALTTQELTTEKTTEIEATVYSTTNSIKTDDPTTVELTTDDWKTTEPQPVTPAICPDGYFGNQPHPEQCDAYYLCSGWSPILLFCSNGFEFDPVTGTCVAISEDGCTWHQTSTSTTTKEITQTTKGPSSSDAITEGSTQKVTTVHTEPAPDSTTLITTERTIEPITEEWITSEITTKPATISIETTINSETDDQSTTEKITTTTITENNTTNDVNTSELTTVQSTTEGKVITTDEDTFTTDDFTIVSTTTKLPENTIELTEVTTELTTTTRPICPDGFFGNVPHAEKCDAYYLCSGWNPILLFCTSGFEFDPEIGYCVAITEGGCTWNQISTTSSTTLLDWSTPQTTNPGLTTPPSTTSEITDSFTDATHRDTTIIVVTTERLTTEFSTDIIPTIVETINTDKTDTATLEFSTDAITTESVAQETTNTITPSISENVEFESTTPEFITKQTTDDLTTQNLDTTQKSTTESEEANTITDEPVTKTEITTVITTTESWAETAEYSNWTTDNKISTTENWGITTEQGITSEVTEGVTPSICPDGYFGNIPHPDFCDAYYLCSGWNPILLFCSPGYEFDSYSASCVVITEGGCTWLKTSTTLTIEQTTSENAIEVNTTEWTTEGSTLDLSTNTASLDNTSDTKTDDWYTVTVTKEYTETTTEDLITTVPSITTENLDITTLIEVNATPDWTTTTGKLNQTTLTEITTETTLYSTEPSTGTDDLVATTKYATTDGTITHSTITEQDTTTADNTIVTSTTADPITQEITTQAQLNITTEIDFTTTEIHSTIIEITTTEKVSTPSSESTTIKPTSEIIVTTEETQATTPAICPAGYFGNIPHPERCDAYYLCSGWNPILLFCPAGHEFDPETAACVVKAEGGCTWIQTSTTAVTAQTNTEPSTSTISEELSTTQWLSTLSTTETLTTETIEQVSTTETSTSSTAGDLLTTIENLSTKEAVTEQYTSLKPDNIKTTTTEYLTVASTEIDYVTTAKATEDTSTDANEIEITTKESTLVVTESTTSGDLVEYTTNTPTTDESETSEYSTNSTPITENTAPLDTSTELTTVSDNVTEVSTTTKKYTEENTSTDDLETYSTSTKFDVTTAKLTTDESTPTESTLKLTDNTADLSTVTSEFTTITTEEETTLSNLTTIESTETVPGSTMALTTTEKITTSFDPATTESELTTPIELEGTTEALEATTPAICPDGFFGMVPNPAECDAYYMCTGWMPILLRCPSGYEFDPNTQVCVEIAEGGCTSLSMPSVAPSTESSLTESAGTSPSVDTTTLEISPTDATTEEQATSILFTESTTIEDTEATTGYDDGLTPPNPGIPDIIETTTAIFETVPTTIESTTTEEAIVTDRVETTIQSIPTTEATTIETEKEATTSVHETKTTADLIETVTVGLTTAVVTTESTTVVLESSTITVVDSPTAEPTTELQTTEGAQVTTPVICPDGFFGMVASIEECDVYYLCSGWMPIPLRCPSGYEFSLESQACVLISEGGCSLGRSKIVAKAKEETKHEDEITNNKLNEVDKDSETDSKVIHLEAGGNTEAVNEETIKEICKPGFYENVKKVGSCNTFLKCIDGAAIEMQCLLGTKFDATLQKCVPTSQSGCMQLSHRELNQILI